MSRESRDADSEDLVKIKTVVGEILPSGTRSTELGTESSESLDESELESESVSVSESESESESEPEDEVSSSEDSSELVSSELVSSELELSSAV